jgi:hypothetical protein
MSDNNLRESLKKALPEPVVGIIRESRDALVRAGQWPAATFHPWRRDSIKRLKAIKGKYQGERCFIMGNGPSLKVTDLSLLKNEFTIGTNRIFLGFPEMGFQTSFFLSVNDLVIEQSAADIMKLGMPKFIAWRSRKWLSPAENLNFIHTTYTGPGFARDISGRVWEGGTVTNVALQLAYHLGFTSVILVGVDHNYVTTGKPNATVVSQGDDPNHFHPGYFGKGFRWQLPDIKAWEYAYDMSRRAYEEDGREVMDATVGGKLQVFKKVAYASLFREAHSV